MRNFSIDCMDRFEAAKTPEKRWRVANEIVREIGGSALNVGVLSTSGADMHWFQSSMLDVWMERYLDQAYHEVDPLVRALSGGAERIDAYCGLATRQDVESDHELRLHWDLQDIGYSYGLGQGFSGGAPNTRKAVAIMAADPISQNDTSFHQQARLAGVMIAAYVDPLDPTDPEFYLPGQDLTPPSARERQVLAALAQGYQNKQIAHDLGIAEITVRKHLESVRQKLQARSREEAIAVAARAGMLSL